MPANRDPRPSSVPTPTASDAGLPTAPTWASRDALPAFSPAPGVTVQVVAGGRLMTAWVRIEPDTALALHHHPHEQLGVVLEGAIAVTIAGETRPLTVGHAYAVPPGLVHGGVAGPHGCLVLESFTPPREDYLALAAAAAGQAGNA